ncbi:unnamed protein product [Symbiodinium necroappetens]|uniref:Uncharacterized protein n=1 Tax=Symbiodinium necroappetens TaxID=1628268 RepID=A0A812KJF7_9DINO|nr:unnamed protein product [Symbiodinium necroappetens]
MLSRVYYALTSRKCRRALLQLHPCAVICLLLVLPTAFLAWQVWPAAFPLKDSITTKYVVHPAMAKTSPLPSSSDTDAQMIVQSLRGRPQLSKITSIDIDEKVARPSVEGLRKGQAPAAPTAASTPIPRASGPAQSGPALSAELHLAYKRLIKEYPFQPVRNERGQFVNVILVRSPFRSRHQKDLYQQYKNEILFLGISSFEDYPQPPPNPFSGKFPIDEYVGLFPGFLHMVREPEKIFPPSVKLLLMSQSDFSLPPPQPKMATKYDFTFSGSDQDVRNDCVGWSSFAKNWTFVKEALQVMCGELGMTGVLVATKDKQDRKACSIPASCEGKIVQTKFLSQQEFFAYVRQSKFLFVPQVHDASPRVTTQALALDVPLLMNWHLIGGWKYLNNKTGEFFHAPRLKSVAEPVHAPHVLGRSLADSRSDQRKARPGWR